MQLPADPTLDEIRDALIADVAANAAFDGWTMQAVAVAAQMHGIDADIAALAFDAGAVDMIDRWFAHIDLELARRLPADALASMKVRERITALIDTRISIVEPDKEALRRALAILAMPQNLPRAARLGWRAADHMWRLAGDTATDLNHYTKRATLSAVYGSTMAVFVADESDGHAETRAFLARRIENVMAFEKWKAGARSRSRDRPSLSRFISRLRYPAA